MKTINLGQTLNVLANLAVVAGIVFLVIQIRQERDYAVVESTTIVGLGMADWMSSVAHDQLTSPAVLVSAASLGFLLGESTQDNVSDAEHPWLRMLVRSMPWTYSLL